MKQFYQMETDEVKKQINGSLEPLSEKDVREHQEKYVMNELQE